jgi:hypothetical protein
MCKEVERMCEEVERMCKGVERMCKDVERMCKEVERMCKEVERMCKGVERICKEVERMCKGRTRAATQFRTLEDSCATPWSRSCTPANSGTVVALTGAEVPTKDETFRKPKRRPGMEQMRCVAFHPPQAPVQLLTRGGDGSRSPGSRAFASQTVTMKSIRPKTLEGDARIEH